MMYVIFHSLLVTLTQRQVLEQCLPVSSSPISSSRDAEYSHALTTLLTCAAADSQHDGQHDGGWVTAEVGHVHACVCQLLCTIMLINDTHNQHTRHPYFHTHTHTFPHTRTFTHTYVYPCTTHTHPQDVLRTAKHVVVLSMSLAAPTHEDTTPPYSNTNTTQKPTVATTTGALYVHKQGGAHKQGAPLVSRAPAPAEQPSTMMQSMTVNHGQPQTATAHVVKHGQPHGQLHGQNSHDSNHTMPMMVNMQGNTTLRERALHIHQLLAHALQERPVLGAGAGAGAAGGGGFSCTPDTLLQQSHQQQQPRQGFDLKSKSTHVGKRWGTTGIGSSCLTSGIDQENTAYLANTQGMHGACAVYAWCVCFMNRARVAQHTQTPNHPPTMPPPTPPLTGSTHALRCAQPIAAFVVHALYMDPQHMHPATLARVCLPHRTSHTRMDMPRSQHGQHMGGQHGMSGQRDEEQQQHGFVCVQAAQEEEMERMMKKVGQDDAAHIQQGKYYHHQQQQHVGRAVGVVLHCSNRKGGTGYVIEVGVFVGCVFVVC